MELRQLKYFLAVADARSFVAAAEKQYVSRQAISKSVAQLEEELNVELFMRDSGGAFLTPAGLMFYERVRPMVMELDSVRSQMQAYGARYHQRIRIAFSIGTMALLEQHLADYRENQHNVDLSYEEHTEEVCRKLLMERQADVLITTEQLTDPSLLTKELLSSPVGILIREQKELQDVTVHDLSWIPLAGQDNSQTAAFCKKNGVALRYKGFDYHRLFQLTAEGKCALILPRCLVPAGMDGVRWLPIQDGGQWKLFISYPRSVEKNLMYSAALDDLHQQVFQPLREKEMPL